ncbi:hypothetical protein SAMN05660691_01645 [Rheinheimera pacifica]|uniref:Uncharacterized protein n=1 Tax=Rheinheimera pacifica TaxID=173990 RepID=A0A1H6L4K7_9GAMM|nr:hypothetical protein [Rheinheimera pacifica]SEH83207.1 hypothetical protein SAMN05660691_01645 [Rheinheimera pacifica]
MTEKQANQNPVKSSIGAGVGQLALDHRFSIAPMLDWRGGLRQVIVL